MSKAGERLIKAATEIRDAVRYYQWDIRKTAKGTIVMVPRDDTSPLVERWDYFDRIEGDGGTVF